MTHGNYVADRVSSFVVGLSVIAIPVMFFIDWRFSILAGLIIWNQLVFRSALRGDDTGIKFSLSLGVILIYIWHFFITW